MRTTRVPRILLVTVLTMAVLAVVAWRVDVAAVAKAMLGVDPAWLVPAAAVALLFNTVQSAEALRWMLRGFGVRLGFGPSLAATAGNMAIKAALPAGSGELARVAWLKRARSVDVKSGTAAVVTLLWFKLVWLLVIATVGLWVSPGSATGLRLPVAACASVALFATLLAPRLLARVSASKGGSPPWREIPRRLAGAFRAMRPGPLCVGAMHALVAVTAEMAVFAMLLQAAGGHVSPVQVAGRLPLVIIGAKVPLTLMGLGTREGLVLLLFAGSSPSSVLTTAALLFSVTEYLLPAMLGALLTWSYVRRLLP